MYVDRRCQRRQLRAGLIAIGVVLMCLALGATAANHDWVVDVAAAASVGFLAGWAAALWR